MQLNLSGINFNFTKDNNSNNNNNNNNKSNPLGQLDIVIENLNNLTQSSAELTQLKAAITRIEKGREFKSQISIAEI